MLAEYSDINSTNGPSVKEKRCPKWQEIYGIALLRIRSSLSFINYVLWTETIPRLAFDLKVDVIVRVEMKFKV